MSTRHRSSIGTHVRTSTLGVSLRMPDQPPEPHLTPALTKVVPFAVALVRLLQSAVKQVPKVLTRAFGGARHTPARAMNKAKALADRAAAAKERAKDTVNKVRAERTDGLVDERLQAKHQQLMAPLAGLEKLAHGQQPISASRLHASRPYVAISAPAHRPSPAGGQKGLRRALCIDAARS